MGVQVIVVIGTFHFNEHPAVRRKLIGWVSPGEPEKMFARTIAALILMVLSGFGHAWLAPWSDDMGILLMEPIAIGLSIVLFGAATLVLLLVLRRLSPRLFVGKRITFLLCMANLIGITLSIYLYPPMERMLEPTQGAGVAAGQLAERLKESPPWGESLADKSLHSVQWNVMKAPKGFFGWSPREPWVIRFLFRYGDGSVAKATYHMAESGPNLERLLIDKPVQSMAGTKNKALPTMGSF